MATKILNIHDYADYIKCGEILKSPLPNYKNPFILKCYQCDRINFILESFIIHVQEHCENLSTNEVKDDEVAINSIVKVETVVMEVEDPLVHIKQEISEERIQEQNFGEDNEDFEEDSTESDVDNQTDDNSTDEKVKRSKNNKINCNTIYSPNVEKIIKSKPNMKVLIEFYKNQTNLWNKDSPYYRLKDKKQESLEEIANEMNSKLNWNLTWKEISAVISYIYQKHRMDFKRLRRYEEEFKIVDDKKYKKCWFFDELNFLRPKSLIQLQKLDANYSDLSKEQVIQIIQIYREFPNLWNSNLIEFICSNKRHAAHNEMLKCLEQQMNININLTVLEEYLRTIHHYFSKEKRMRRKHNFNKNKNHKDDDFYEHLLYLYAHEGPFNCSECKRILPKPLLYKLNKSSHDGSVPLICSQCNKEFKTMQSYTVHAKRHFEDLEFACSICNKKFVAYGVLRLHLITHTGDRPYCCEICGGSYRQVQCLNRHRRRHEKRYSHTCHLCSRGYYSKKTYEDHMNSHMNIRQHICKLCGKGFITAKALKTHAVTHEDARNHACKLCGKTFKLKIGVLQHMRTHGSRFESEDKTK